MAHLEQSNYKELYRNDPIPTPGIDAMMREVLHMLGKIDFEHEAELEKIEESPKDEAIKNYIKRKIRAAYYETYVELLATLRQRQHRLSHPGLKTGEPAVQPGWRR
jgi:hypothetical protein